MLTQNMVTLIVLGAVAALAISLILEVWRKGRYTRWLPTWLASVCLLAVGCVDYFRPDVAKMHPGIEIFLSFLVAALFLIALLRSLGLVGDPKPQ